MNRRGGKASGFTLSIGISIIYWILFLAGQNFVSQGKLSPYVGLWIGNALLGSLGIALFLLRERSEGLQLSVLVPTRLQRTLAALRRRRDREWEVRTEAGAETRRTVARMQGPGPTKRRPLRAVAPGD